MFRIFLMLVLIVFATVIYFATRKLISLFKNFQPKDKNVKKDIDRFRLALAARTEDLVPWSEEEMQLLSLREVEQKIKNRGTKEIEGTLKSIYQEPMVQYVYKKYVQPTNAVLIAKTSNREFIYRIRKKGIQIYMNNSPLGLLRKNGVLYTSDNKGVAQIKQNKEAYSIPILVNNQEKGSLLNKGKTDKEFPRAFELLAPMQTKEEDYFLSIAILELAMRNVNSK